MRYITKVKIIFVFLIIVGIVMIEYQDVKKHEIIHQGIFDDYGIESEIHMNTDLKKLWAGELAYTSASVSDYYTNCNDFCIMQQNLNEIINYNADTQMINIWFVFAMYLFYDYLIRREPK